ncbi:hypothetical protein ACW5W8_16345 [Aeromonas aquatilis]
MNTRSIAIAIAIAIALGYGFYDGTEPNRDTHAINLKVNIKKIDKKAIVNDRQKKYLLDNYKPFNERVMAVDKWDIYDGNVSYAEKVTSNLDQRWFGDSITIETQSNKKIIVNSAPAYTSNGNVSTSTRTDDGRLVVITKRENAVYMTIEDGQELVLVDGQGWIFKRNSPDSNSEG